MGKLTKELREEIAVNASETLFQKEFEDLRNRKKNFGDKLFSKHIAKPEQYALMEKLPAEFFDNRNSIIVNFIGFREHQIVPFSNFRRTPALAKLSVDINDSALAKEWEKLQIEVESLAAQRKDLVKEIRKVLLSATTTDKLLVIWPECRPFIPAYAFLEGGTKNVPALLVANLTAKLIEAGAQLQVKDIEKSDA